MNNGSYSASERRTRQVSTSIRSDSQSDGENFCCIKNKDTFKQLKNMLCRRIRANYEKLSEFERSRIIELHEADWANWRITCPMGRSDTTIRRCWQKLMDNGRFQHHDNSGQPADQEDRLIFR
ncbi:hypothetical protein TNCV_506341 [Trichonephila clavipes]|nr:hypothetical protein TNCV_506341 [Trichonephila clavipes]